MPTFRNRAATGREDASTESYHSPVEVRLHSLLRHVGEIVLHPADRRHPPRRHLPPRERVRPRGERRQREQLPRPRPGLGRPQAGDVAAVHPDHDRVGGRGRRRGQPRQPPPRRRRPPPRPRMATAAAQHPPRSSSVCLRLVWVC